MRIEYLCGDCAMPYATRKEADECFHKPMPTKRVAVCDCGDEVRGNFCGRCGEEVKETE